MAETVRVCKDNINTALDSINHVADGITEAEDVAEILIERRAMINSEFEVYIKSMTRCRELITYFEGDLAYFKDSYAIAEKLVTLIIKQLLFRKVL
jgi:predicted nucleic-acid-binding protein